MHIREPAGLSQCEFAGLPQIHRNDYPTGESSVEFGAGCGEGIWAAEVGDLVELIHGGAGGEGRERFRRSVGARPGF